MSIHPKQTRAWSLHQFSNIFCFTTKIEQSRVTGLGYTDGKEFQKSNFTDWIVIPMLAFKQE